MEVSPPFSRVRAVGLANGKAELIGILEACRLGCFEPEIVRIFKNAIGRLFYSEGFRIEKAVLSQRRVRSRLHLLNGMILRTAEGKLYANLERDAKNSMAYTMTALFNCIAESGSDLLIGPYLGSLRMPPEGR